MVCSWVVCSVVESWVVPLSPFVVESPPPVVDDAVVDVVVVLAGVGAGGLGLGGNGNSAGGLQDGMIGLANLGTTEHHPGAVFLASIIVKIARVMKIKLSLDILRTFRGLGGS